MRQRKRRQREASSEALIRKESTEEEIGDDGDEREQKGFYACYLLVSLSPRHKGHTYIGFTVNPRRRIRQHNGEIRCGAWRTKKRRPWEMVLCIHGFPSNVSALQFEWAWQHPNESLAVRKAAVSFKSLSGIANKIKLAYTMLTLPSWHSLNITVNYFSTKYTKHSAGCPGLPHHMKVKICPMDELPCYVKGDESLVENGYGWDNEERDEACSGSEIAEETLPDPMFGNAIKHDKNGLGDEMGNGLYGWLSEEAACGGSKIEACSGSEIAEETLPDPMFGNVIRHDKNSLGDEMGDGLYGWVSEETACGGRKIETLPDPMFWNVEEHDKSDLGNGIADGLYGWMSEGEDCREKSTHAELLARPSSNASTSSTIVGAVVEDTGISGLVKDNSFPSKRPAKEISGFLVTIDDEQPPSRDIVPSEVEVIDVTTPSPLCRSSLWDKKFNKGGRNKEHRNMPSEAEVIDLTTPPSLCRSSLWSDLINYA